MTDHHIRVTDDPWHELPYRWRCSCGDKGRRRYGYVGIAESAGRGHATAMNALDVATKQYRKPTA